MTIYDRLHRIEIISEHVQSCQFSNISKKIMEKELNTHLSVLRKHIQKQDAVIKAFKAEYPSKYKICKEIARMKTEQRKCLGCSHYKRCNRMFGVLEDSVECDWTPSRWHKKGEATDE